MGLYPPATLRWSRWSLSEAQRPVKLVFIHGPAAVGKLTVARRLGEMTGLPVFHNHLVVDMLLTLWDFGAPPFIELREAIWLEVMGRAAQEQLSGLIFTFTQEKTVRPQFVQELVTCVERAKGQVLFVQLTCPVAELEKRIEDPSRAEWRKLRSLSLFRQLREAGTFAFPPLPVDLTLDTSQLTPTQVAEQIISHFGLPSRL